MLRHAIAPARSFSQTPNEIIRHPRLNGTAVRLLQWALSLPEGSRETVQSIGEKMPEERIAVRNARRQLEAEGLLHTRRKRDRATDKWCTQVLVSNVALTAPEEIDAAFEEAACPKARVLTVVEPAVQAVGASPKGENTEENTTHPILPPSTPSTSATPSAGLPEPPPSDHGPTAAVLYRLGEREPRLRLGAAEAAALAPLAAEWLTRGASELELQGALTTGLPPIVHAPAAFVADRLRRKLPAPRTSLDPAAPAGPLPECAECRDPLPRGQDVGICSRCAGVLPAPEDVRPAITARGISAVREALRNRHTMPSGPTSTPAGT
ncbi:hypothetical protein [Streptomyces sp. KR80]|uniref:hypothetical protein n=1 Tax=Streptomyces sp. KR80 TaxID=3457426 RepID=UPI003FD565AA